MSSINEHPERQQGSSPDLRAASIKAPQASLDDASMGRSLAGLKPVVEERLLHLRVGKELLLDQNLKPQTDRGEISMLSFRKLEGGEYEVTNGINSLNGSYVKVGERRKAVESYAPVKGGEVMMFGGTQITAPDYDRPGKTEMEQALNNLEPGESILVGRSYFDELDGDHHVSRKHATITRVDDYEGPDGEPRKLFNLADSIKHEHQVFVDTPDGDIEPLDGKTTLGPGRTLYLADGTSIEIPEPMAALDYTQMIRGQVSAMESMTMSMMSLDMDARGGSMSVMFRAPIDVDESKMLVAPTQAQLLGLHIHEGLRLIRNGHYDEAKSHFEKPEVLEECGFSLEQGNFIGKTVSEITGEDAFDIIQTVAGRSWFMHGNGYNNGRVVPSFGILQKESGELTPHEADIVKEFEREICLIYAEEWTHAYQHAMGGPVSKRGVLLEVIPGGTNVHEHDIAQFFKEQKIPMSPMFLNRYGRDDALDQLSSYASKEEQRQIRTALVRAEVGESVSFGTAPKGDRVVKIEKAVEGLSLEQEMNRSQYLGKQIGGNHATITPIGAGKYEVSPLYAGTPVFQRDNHGIWRRLQGSAEVRSGTRIRLGSSFEFKLP